jgi:hypothetical protein
MATRVTFKQLKAAVLVAVEARSAGGGRAAVRQLRETLGALERQALGFLGEIAGPDAGRLWTRQRETSLQEDIVQGWTSAAREQQNVLTLIAWVREKIRRRCRALTLRRAVFGATRLLTVAGGRLIADLGEADWETLSAGLASQTQGFSIFKAGPKSDVSGLHLDGRRNSAALGPHCLCRPGAKALAPGC